MSTVDELRVQLADRYRIDRELGRGGMGAVYLARDLRLDRPVAIKVLPPEFASQAALRERFLRETRTAASFSHPNIVPVYAIEETDAVVAYVMGFVEGESLADRVKRAGPLTARETVRLLQDVGYALAYAHGRGIVHRDIKPDNVMIERATGRALVMDFGVARVIAGAGPDAGLTRVGEVVGTPEYMSPEQATGDVVDGRSDLYALGLTAYFALTGRAAMSADSTSKVFVRQITEVLPPMRTLRTDLPAPLAEAIDRCLAKDPAARFQRAEALVEALDVAQLAAPEIPVPIRLFAQEAGTLSMVLIFGGLLGFVVVRSQMAQGVGNADVLLPVLLLVGVFFTRALQTFSEARRLARSGFSAGDVHRGLTAVVAERQSRRDELRGDERTRRVRRRTIAMGVVELAAALVMFVGGLSFRIQRDGGYATPIPGIILIFSGTILLGISAVLLLRSPFRMPVGERLFRLVWLGPLGRGFARLAGRGIARGSGAGSLSAANVTVTRGSSGRRAARAGPVPSPVGVAAPDRVAGLEARVAELERWRSNAGAD
ncbi:MAG: putative serine/threonine protein kinase [Gemmatimonadetes bacterium]|nr:putative serine/threonine protein kinase [Gemmatimonadota bacterium]